MAKVDREGLSWSPPLLAHGTGILASVLVFPPTRERCSVQTSENGKTETNLPAPVGIETVFSLKNVDRWNEANNGCIINLIRTDLIGLSSSAVGEVTPKPFGHWFSQGFSHRCATVAHAVFFLLGVNLSERPR